MKVAVFADAHIGKGNDSKILLDASEKFFTEVFFPEVDAREIDSVIDLGDTFDRRKYINFNTLHRAQQFLIRPLVERGLSYHHLTGNHEVFHKHTSEVNTWDAIFGDHHPPRFNFVNDTSSMVIAGLVLVPWINEDNVEFLLPVLENGGRALFAHLDLDGFPTEGGEPRRGGMDRKLVSGFGQVFSGHFHTQSRQDNVRYVGSVGQYTWGDYGDERGFHVLDTETLEMEFVKNPYTPFKKVFYDDSTEEAIERTKRSMHDLEGKFVKLVIKHKTDPAAFDSVIDLIEKQTDEITPVDAHLHADDAQEVDIAPAEDTLSILRKYAETAPVDVDRRRVTSILEELYTEAQGPDGL
jgi:DNA repair exonuclease SbcCD nuclease subunit